MTLQNLREFSNAYADWYWTQNEFKKVDAFDAFIQTDEGLRLVTLSGIVIDTINSVSFNEANLLIKQAIEKIVNKPFDQIYSKKAGRWIDVVIWRQLYHWFLKTNFPKASLREIGVSYDHSTVIHSIKTIQNRTFQIKNAIEFLRFTAGYN